MVLLFSGKQRACIRREDLVARILLPVVNFLLHPINTMIYVSKSNLQNHWTIRLAESLIIELSLLDFRCLRPMSADHQGPPVVQMKKVTMLELDIPAGP